MPQNSSDDQLIKEIYETLKEQREVLQQRRQIEYDGIMGSLPAEWSLHFHNEFDDTRNILLKKCSHKDALKYLADYPLYFEPDYNPAQILVPVGLIKLIGTLRYYYDAYQLGPEGGLR